VGLERQVLSAVRATARVREKVRRARPAVVRSWRSPHGVERLVPSPVFVLSPARSGSTLLRVLLNSHSRICAPHELHLRRLHVQLEDTNYARLAMKELGLDEEALEHLLWDRIMHRQLQRTGKSVFVEKTPGNGAIWERLVRAWPEARFIYLIRHPAAILASMQRAYPDVSSARLQRRLLTYATRVDAARSARPGPLVRYENLTAEPESVLRDLCSHLDVRFEPRMLEYGRARHGRFRSGIGDWSENIRSGEVRAARPLPADEDVPPGLQAQCRAWGYLSRT
jgi:hypothetical protein